LEASGRLRKGRYVTHNLSLCPLHCLSIGESLHTAVVREVKEETGVTAEFVGVINFRQMHPHLFGKSDIYFVCLLRY